MHRTKTFEEQECIPVGCVPPACCPYLPACTGPGGCTWSQGGCTWCTWSRGCTWSQGVYLVWVGVPGPEGCTWSWGEGWGVPGPGGVYLVWGVNLVRGVCTCPGTPLQQLNSIESTKSLDFVEYYFLVFFIFKITRNNILQIHNVQLILALPIS